MSDWPDPALRDMVTIVPPDGLIAMAGCQVNAPVTIIARRGSARGDYRYFVTEGNEGPHHRLPATLPYFELLRGLAQAGDWPLRDDGQIVFQLEDNPLDFPSVTWEARAEWRSVRLIPDLYYFMGRGYEGFNPVLERWEDRRPSMVWRGSSTGIPWLTLDLLDQLPRYRLCSLAARLGAGADVGMTDVFQAPGPQEEALIRDRLMREGLMRSYVPMEEMARHRYILDIDGNANSWNFMQKLRLGCCVLRVESEWHQWFSDRLLPWQHYVPVASDLSDFLERAEWCFANPVESAAIAARGTRFAQDMTFADEMARAAFTAFAAPGAVADHRS